ncbi:MAG: hypothetical protein GXY83_20815 [Rhodopirellula sp.]|nr:hypothetical protein [Rhodopirellula sp.]
MGLTIHYNIEANQDWTRRQIRRKLEDTRRFAMSLPVVSVSEVVEFRGKDCDYQTGAREAETPDQADARDPFRWAKIQAGRYVDSPWRPGESRRQAPSQMLCLSIHPAKGCEEMNVGWCSFPRFVWKAEKDHVPCWSNVFRGGSYRDSEKLLRAFLTKYRLVKMPDKRARERPCGRSEQLHWTPGGGVSIRSGRYLSHRRGYAPGHVELQLDDYAHREIRFRFRGAIDEARLLFAGRRFKTDLEDIIHGKEQVIPAAHGVWSSFCKTQYANDPRRGGWANFQCAHLSVCAILEHMQRIGFKVEVSDEGGFWEKRDLAALAQEIGEWDAMLAGLGGVLKDAAEARGVGFESAMSGRPDFERLESQAQSIGNIAGHLAGLREHLLPAL